MPVDNAHLPINVVIVRWLLPVRLKACPVLKKVSKIGDTEFVAQRQYQMDLETFLTTLYVYVDDWYKDEVRPHFVKHAGAEAQLSDSEVLTMADRRAMESEGGVVRWMQRHRPRKFPKMVGRSAFNARVGC